MKRGVNEKGDAYRGGWGAGLGAGFTLLEMLMVMAIIGILAAIVGPSLGNFKPNATAAATQQLLTDLGRARQLAMSQHTTVCMVFLGPGFSLDPNCIALQNLAPQQWSNCVNLLDKQYTGYNFVSLRTVGDQPGQRTPHYWSAWKNLPDGVFIASNKFSPLYQTTPFNIYANVAGQVGVVTQYATVNAFSNTANIPFPSELAPGVRAGQSTNWTQLPYIAFNYLGQLVTAPSVTAPDGTLRAADEIIPLARGSVLCPHNAATKVGNPSVAAVAAESPPGNSVSNSFTLICVDRLTGRAYVKRQEVQ